MANGEYGDIGLRGSAAKNLASPVRKWRSGQVCPFSLWLPLNLASRA